MPVVGGPRSNNKDKNVNAMRYDIDRTLCNGSGVDGSISEEQVDMVMNKLMQVRQNNDDVVVMDKVMSGEINAKSNYVNPLLAEQYANARISREIDEEILHDLERNTHTFDNQIQNTINRNKKIIEMKKESEKTMENILTPEDTKPVIKTEDIIQDIEIEPATKSNTIKEIEEQDKRFQEEINKMAADSDREIAEADSEEAPMTDEELNDVPASTITVSDNELKSALKSKVSEDISDEDAQQILNVIKKYQSGEKFKVFDELPKILQDKITETIQESGQTTMKLREFFAKTILNEFVSDTGMDVEIRNFNQELAEATKGLGNFTGMVIDEYSNELKDKFYDNLISVADKIQEEDPERAEKIRSIATAFDDAIHLKSVYEKIKTTPSVINRAYKEAMFHYDRYCTEFSIKHGNCKPKLKQPKVIEESIMNNLASTRELARTVTILILQSIDARSSDSGDNYMGLRYKQFDSVADHVYAYYALLGFVNLNFTANRSEIVNNFREAVKEILLECASYMLKISTGKGNSKSKGSRKRKN